MDYYIGIANSNSTACQMRPFNHKQYPMRRNPNYGWREAAEALRLSEERYRTAFQTSLDSVNISNRLDNGVYVDVNQAFLNTLGDSKRHEVLGRTYFSRTGHLGESTGSPKVR